MSTISLTKLTSIGLTAYFLGNRFTNALEVPVMMLVLLSLLDAGGKIQKNGQTSSFNQVIGLFQAFKSLAVWPFHGALIAILIWGCNPAGEMKPVFTRGNLPRGTVSSTPLKVARPNNTNAVEGRAPTKTFINQPPPNQPAFPRSPNPNLTIGDAKTVKTIPRSGSTSGSGPTQNQEGDNIGAASSNGAPRAPASK